MPTMKFTVDVDLDSILDDTKNELANNPLSEIESTITNEISEALSKVVFNTGADVTLKDEQGKEIYL